MVMKSALSSKLLLWLFYVSVVLVPYSISELATRLKDVDYGWILHITILYSNISRNINRIILSILARVPWLNYIKAWRAFSPWDSSPRACSMDTLRLHMVTPLLCLQGSIEHTRHQRRCSRLMLAQLSSSITLRGLTAIRTNFSCSLNSEQGREPGSYETSV